MSNKKANVVRKIIFERSLEENKLFIKKDLENENVYFIEKGFVPNMKVSAKFYANKKIFDDLISELEVFLSKETQTALPSLVQISNVAALPGIVGHSFGLPDMHSGYGFSVGNCAAFDIENPLSIVSPGGIGFDIGCGVRLIRTSLMADDLKGKEEILGKELSRLIPSGMFKSNKKRSLLELDQILKNGMKWSVEKDRCWKEDLVVCEDKGCLEDADPTLISSEIKERGSAQLGTLGSGNHYVEVQIVSEIINKEKAAVMGIKKEGQVCIMVHTGSRGFGHGICSQQTAILNKIKELDETNDLQLTGVRICSKEGKEYLKKMACAINYAYVNRTEISFEIRKAFSSVFEKTPLEMDMHVVYDISHNTAKIEENVVDGKLKKLLVHRKGATRAFGPYHPDIPEKYKEIGQPIIVGGSMGTYSYVLTGVGNSIYQAFGTTCHGAGRIMSRTQAQKNISYDDLKKELERKGVFVYGCTEKGLIEEAPCVYKDVKEVVDVSEKTNLSKVVFQVKPICVIKG